MLPNQRPILLTLTLPMEHLVSRLPLACLPGPTVQFCALRTCRWHAGKQAQPAPALGTVCTLTHTLTGHKAHQPNSAALLCQLQRLGDVQSSRSPGSHPEAPTGGRLLV